MRYKGYGIEADAQFAIKSNLAQPSWREHLLHPEELLQTPVPHKVVHQPKLQTQAANRKPSGLMCMQFALNFPRHMGSILWGPLVGPLALERPFGKTQLMHLKHVFSNISVCILCLMTNSAARQLQGRECVTNVLVSTE